MNIMIKHKKRVFALILCVTMAVGNGFVAYGSESENNAGLVNDTVSSDVAESGKVTSQNETDEKSISENGLTDISDNEATEEQSVSGADTAQEKEPVKTSEAGEITEPSLGAMSGKCGKEGSDVSWEVTGTPDNYTLTISGAGQMEDESIEDIKYAPWSEENIGVYINHIIVSEGITAIGKGSFLGLTEVEDILLPESLLEIGDNAFAGDKISSIILPANLKKIGSGVFSGLYGLEAINIPESLEIIGNGSENPFNYCNNLKTITVSEGNLFFSASDNVLFDKEKIKLLCYPIGKPEENYTIPDTVKIIARRAFVSSGLKNLPLMSNVKEIQEGAFIHCCSFNEVVIPEGVEYIGDAVFQDDFSLSKITLPSTLKEIGWDSSRNDYRSKGIVGCRDGREITVEFSGNNPYFYVENGALFYRNSGGGIELVEFYKDIEGTYTVPEGVQRLWQNVFRDTSVSAVNLPSSLRNIASWTVQNCKNLKELVLPEGVKTVEKYLVARSSVSQVYIPESIEVMDPDVFYEANELKDVHYAGTQEKWNSVFKGTLPSGVIVHFGKKKPDPEPSPEPGPEPSPEPGKNTHTVIFMDDDKEFARQTVEDGKKVTEPSPNPSKTGYDFMGWVKGTSLWNFSTPVYSSFTLYSKYMSASSDAVSSNTGSGMDSVARIESTDKGKVIYLVKGQTYNAGSSGWSVRSGGGISVAAKTGKITAKKRGHYLVEHDGEVITVAVAAPQFEKTYKTRSVMVGKTGWIELNVNPENKDELNNYPVTWTTANPGVAIVNGGTITALAKGSTSVYAYVGGKKYTAKINVSDTCKAPGVQKTNYPRIDMNPLQTVNLKFDKNVFTVNKAAWDGDGLEATKNEKNGKTDGGYKNKVIAISKTGKITAIGMGSTYVHGRDEKNRDVYLTVNVVKIPMKEAAYITKNKSTTIKFPFVKNNFAKWDTSNKDVIPSVTNGKVKGTAVGNSTISCNYKDFDFNTLVYVEDPEFSTDDSLKLENNKYVMVLKVGTVYNRLKMKNVFQTVNYKSSKPAVAFVDENGVIYARSAGKANISTKINGKTYKIAVTVQ